MILPFLTENPWLTVNAPQNTLVPSFFFGCAWPLLLLMGFSSPSQSFCFLFTMVSSFFARILVVIVSLKLFEGDCHSFQEGGANLDVVTGIHDSLFLYLV
jgi:hypothetical protein